MVLKLHEPFVHCNNRKHHFLFSQVQALSNIEKSMPSPSWTFSDHSGPSNTFNYAYIWAWLGSRWPLVLFVSLVLKEDNVQFGHPVSLDEMVLRRDFWFLVSPNSNYLGLSKNTGLT